jgi:hypothetical protein
MPYLRAMLLILRTHAPAAALCAVLAVVGICVAQTGALGDPRATVAAATGSAAGGVLVVETQEGALGVTAAALNTELPDIWIVPLRVAPSGVPVRAGHPRNVTKTAGAAERILGKSGSLVLVALDVDGRTVSLTALDLSGEHPGLTQGWSDVERAQARVSNWQRTGTTAGIGWQRLVFGAPVEGLSASVAAKGTFALTSAGQPWGVVTFAPRFATPPNVTLTVTAEAPRREDQTRGRNGHVGWIVDTVRDLPFVGSAKIALLEDVAFNLLDTVKRSQQDLEDPATVVGPGLLAEDTPSQAWHVASEDGDDAALRVAGDVQRDRVWPPRGARAKVDPPGPGEGQWKPVTALVRPSDDAVPYFYQSWLRPDPARRYARVSVTAFDPSRVEIGLVAGTREPESTTGLKGSGSIPRRTGLMPRVVAAFNGGFQSKHGPYGMVEEGRILVPPAGDAATVAATTDGRVLLGTWPATGPSPGWKSLAPGEPLPPLVHSLRQNLQPLVADGRFNPDRRKKWGSVAGKHIKDNTHTVRTGICLLEGGGVAYFFGPSLSADTLGQAMLDFHCDYGVHLDMNSGHSGFEFYRVEDDAGEKFEAARMIKDMWHMNFPRYIKRDARDFFYLRLRESPGERLERTTGRVWKRAGARPDAPSEVLVSGRIHRLPARRTTGSVVGSESLAAGALMIPVAGGEAVVEVAGTKVRVTAKPRAFTLVGHSADDVFVTVSDDVEGDTKTLTAWGCTEVVAIPRPPETRPVLRLADTAGNESLRGGPLERDGRVLALVVAPSGGRSGRLESVFAADAD